MEIIKDITHLLSSGKTALFCGAGFSLHAGIPLAREIEMGIFKNLKVSPDHVNTYVNKKIPFERTMETLLSNSQFRENVRRLKKRKQYRSDIHRKGIRGNYLMSSVYLICDMLRES